MYYNIFIIGAGRLGTTLGCALQSERFRIQNLYNHSGRGLKKLKHHFPEASIWKKINSRSIDKSDIIFLTVRDDIIPLIISDLQNLNVTWQNKTVIHTSGILTSSVLKPLADNGGNIASMHPMQTFSTKFCPSSIFKDILLACEGTPTAINLCKNISKKLKTRFFLLNPELKVPYHLGGTFAANLSIALIGIADKLFCDCRIDKENRVNAIRSLIYQVIENYQRIGVKPSLTGPLARGDYKTIIKHLEYISDVHPEIQAIYKNLSKYITNEYLDPELKDENKTTTIFE